MSKYYKITAFILMSFLANSLQGQNCKYKRNEVEEFTKKKILETTDNYLSATFSDFTKAKARKINDIRILDVFYSHLGKTFSIVPNSEFMLLDKNGEVISLKAEKYDISNANVSKIATTNTVNLSFPLDEETYKKLVASEIVKVRVNTNSGYVDMPVKENYWKKVQGFLKCIE